MRAIATIAFLAVCIARRAQIQDTATVLTNYNLSQPTHGDNVQRCQEICDDQELAAKHRARILGTVENYASQDAPVYIYMFGGTATGKSYLQKHVEKLAVGNEPLIDASKDGLMWQWDQEWLALMGAPGLTRKQRFDIRAVTRGCRMGADAVTYPLADLAIAGKKHVYQECTRTDAAKSPQPLNELYEDDAERLNASRTKWSDYAIYYALNVAFDIDSRIEAEAERAERNGFIVPEETLKGQLPLDYQWTYVKNAVAFIKTGIGRSHRFFVQRKCKVKEPLSVVDITEQVNTLAAETGGTPEDFPWTKSEIHNMLNQWAPVRSKCPAASAVE